MQESINLTWTQKSTVPGVTSQNGDIGLSWLCNYSQTRHHWEDSRMWEWVWNAHCNTETRADFMGGWEEWITSQRAAALQATVAPGWEAFPWVYISSAGKRDTGVTSASCSQEPLLWFCLYRALLGFQHHHSDLGRPCSYLQSLGSLNQWLAQSVNQVSSVAWPGNSEGPKFCLISVFNEEI